MGYTPGIAVVTRPTRLAGLRARWGTKSQAKFVLRAARAQEQVLHRDAPAKSRSTQIVDLPPDAEFGEYEREDAAYQRAVERILRDLDFGLPVKRVDRDFVPNFDFWSCAAVVVIGQDGLVANVAKYVGDVPIIAANPDPERIDGVLLPFQVPQVRLAVDRVLRDSFRQRKVTLAEVNLNDGQKLLAFNDFFVGTNSHVSARYTLEVGGASEPQSSSGILVSTGAGSTGWLSSVFNMTSGIARLLGHELDERLRLQWEDRKLMWAVREPFVSRHSQANLIAGILDEGRELVIESLMPANGVIFSDGIENDYLTFTSGTIARIGVSKQAARLVVP